MGAPEEKLAEAGSVVRWEGEIATQRWMMENEKMRIPDRDYRPRKKTAIGIAAVLVGVMAGVSIYNYTHREVGNPSQVATSTTVPRREARLPGTGPATTRSVLETLKQQDEIDLVMKRGWQLINKRDAQSAGLAAEIFREALRDAEHGGVDPDNAQFYNGLGRACLIEGKPEEALDAFQKGLAIDPSIADMESGMGWAYWQMHRPWEARQAWEAGLRLDPQSADSWSALAWIYLALGDNTKAKEGFTVLVNRDSKDSAAVMGLSMSRSAVQVDIQSIEKYFPLPDLRYLKGPAATTAP